MSLDQTVNAWTSRRSFQAWETLVLNMDGTQEKRYQTPKTLSWVRRLRLLTVKAVFHRNQVGTLQSIWDPGRMAVFSFWISGRVTHLRYDRYT
jgi:hypothetical protein